MTDLSADDRALIARYWPDLPEQLLELDWPDRLALAKAWVAEEAARAVHIDAWRKGAAPQPEYTGVESGTTPYVERYTALADRTQRVPGRDLPQEMADVLGAELPPAPPARKKLSGATVVVMIAMTVGLICCGAAASEGLRWLTEGIQ